MHKKSFFLDGPLRGGGGKIPLTTKQKITFFYKGKNWRKQIWTTKVWSGGVTQTLVVRPLLCASSLMFPYFFTESSKSAKTLGLYKVISERMYKYILGVTPTIQTKTVSTIHNSFNKPMIYLMLYNIIYITWSKNTFNIF